MAQHKIDPQNITSPIQLLAAWFVALILLDGAFLTAAGVVTAPSWLPTVLVFASIVNVPLFLGCMFLLQTRFRPEMQSDEHYIEYVKNKEKAKDLSLKVRDQLDATGLNLVDLVRGNPITPSVVENIRPIVEELKNTVKSIQRDNEINSDMDAESLKVLAHGELAVGNWLSAAKILDKYTRYCPYDFEANFSRGVAYANAREGQETNIGALFAYNDAVASMPETIDDNYRARLFTYRGAMLKRMHRFEEAIADFRIAESLPTSEYETNDLMYNLASVYALQNDRKRMMDVVRRIDQKSVILKVIRARLNDYFSKFANDDEFLQLIGAK